MPKAKRSNGKRPPEPTGNDLHATLAEHRICVVVGPGGVGKTTTAASIALGMARRGSRVAVVTIDPAKRLAAALGADGLGNEPRRISAKRLAGAGIRTEPGGQLWAMTLDSRRTFDDLIAELAPDQHSREEVLGNRIYRELANAVAGSQEFTAVAKLHELDSEGGFDLIVLDTPPSRNALDFLDSPARIANFFDGRALQILLRPAGLGLRLAGGGTGLLMGVMRRVTGIDLFGELATFFGAISGMVDGFSERAHAVSALLEHSDTAFAVVCSPEPNPVAEALFLGSELEARRMTAKVVIANRVHADPGVGPRKIRTEQAEEALGRALLARVSAAVREARELARRDAEGLAALAEGMPDAELVEVPMLDGEVHDLAGLARVELHLFAGSGRPEN